MQPLPTQLLSLLFLAAPLADGWLGVYLAGDREEAVVTEVIPGSPAAKAGLQAGDVILAVGDLAVTREQFVAAIQAAKAGDRVRLKVRRQDQESIMVVKLGERPEAVPAPTPAPVPAEPQRGGQPKPAVEPAPRPRRAEPTPRPEAPKVAEVPRRGFLGLSVRETEHGVLVDRVLPDSPAAVAGVAVGETVVTLDEQPTMGLADLDRILGKAEPGRKVAIGLRGPAGVRSLVVVLGEAPKAVAAPDEVVVKPVPVRPSPARQRAVAPVPKPPVPPAASEPAQSGGEPEIEAQLEALRAELRDLRRQLEELRKGKGRE